VSTWPGCMVFTFRWRNPEGLPCFGRLSQTFLSFIPSLSCYLVARLCSLLSVTHFVYIIHVHSLGS
jgi:hypothetical protein